MLRSAIGADAATPEELGCYVAKMAASAAHAKSLGRCQGRLAKNGLAPEFDACVADAVADAADRLEAADARAAATGFACAGDLGSLALDELSSWQQALADSAIFQDSTLPNACVKKRASALSRHAAKYATCLRRGFADSSEQIDACAAKSRASFRAAWTQAELAAACAPADFETVATAAEDAIDAQAALLHVGCGDGVHAGFEECDDGNLGAGDGCDAACVLEACGNGLVQAGEGCDDGGQSATCDGDCTPAECGDGTVNATAGEYCDDGNTSGGDACNATCSLESCGDGRLETPEECDDANTESGDGCSRLCLRETCGRTAGAVACLYCPPGSSPDPAYTQCACDPGYAAGASGCEDIDECAANPCGAGPCDNLPGTYSCPVACTESAFHAALQSCGGPGRAITFDCTDTTILLSDATNGPRRTSCDGLVIDGLDRGITFEMNPKCFGRVLPAEQCRVALDPDGTCSCPDIQSGTVFLSLEGDDMTVRNLAVRYFFDGIKTAGNDNTVENVDFERICDEATGSIAGAGNLYTRITARTACGKCMQNYGDIAATESDPRLRGYYNAIVRDSLFTDCQQPIRMTNAGRYRIEHIRMEGFYASGMFRCLGPRFSSGIGDVQVVHMTGSELDGCDNGVRIGGSVEALVWNNTFVNNEFRGLLATANSRVSMWDNVVRDNGGLATSETGLGGIGVSESAQLDLGGGSLLIDGQPVTSPGRNVVCGNMSPSGAPREVHNLTAATVMAENNYWCTTDPAASMTGPVDTDPYLNAAP